MLVAAGGGGGDGTISPTKGQIKREARKQLKLAVGDEMG